MALSRVADPEPNPPARIHTARPRRGWRACRISDGGWAHSTTRTISISTITFHLPTTTQCSIRRLRTSPPAHMECLGHMGWPATHPVIERARGDSLRKDQTADGSWFGRWGVNYVYGTSGVLRALEAVGLDGSAQLPARHGVAALRCRIRTAGSARSILSLLRYFARKRQREEHRVANCLGPDRLCSRRRLRTIPPWNAPWNGCSHIRMKMEPGTKMNLPAPVSRACST